VNRARCFIFEAGNYGNIRARYIHYLKKKRRVHYNIIISGFDLVSCAGPTLSVSAVNERVRTYMSRI